MQKKKCDLLSQILSFKQLKHDTKVNSTNRTKTQEGVGWSGGSKEGSQSLTL